MRKWQEVLKISSFFEGKKGIDLLRQMPSFVQPVSQLNCTSVFKCVTTEYTFQCLLLTFYRPARVWYFSAPVPVLIIFQRLLKGEFDARGSISA